jgi:ketosteroid isomerase-like protein
MIFLIMLKRTCWLNLLTLFCGLSLFAFDAPGDVSKLNESINTAISKQDVAAMSTLVTDDFQFILRRGDLVDKKGFLDSLKAGTMNPNVQHEVTKTRVYGDTVILTLKAGGAGRSTGIREQWYVVRVFVKQAGAWKLASMQATLITAH